jgi:peroxiredoxin
MSTAVPAPPENAAQLFSLPRALDGSQISLESYRGQKNVVLVFYRGFW